MDNKKAAEILLAIKIGTAHAFLNDDAITSALDTAISALEKQERSNAQNVNSTHRSRPNALESLKILESAKDENGCVPMSLVRQAFRNVLEQDRWIPCREALPDVGQRALVQYKDGTMAVVRCNDAGHLTWFYARMIAWKPAPAHYQEGEA